MGDVKNKDDYVMKKKTNRRDKYLRVKLFKEGKHHYKTIHRLVAETFLPNPDNFPVVDHIDRDCRNNCVENLRWTTQAGNLLNKSLKKNINNNTGVRNLYYNIRTNRYNIVLYRKKVLIARKSFKDRSEAEEYLQQIKKTFSE
jgi:hypothetical protein